jgi:hypothetical protein
MKARLPLLAAALLLSIAVFSTPVSAEPAYRNSDNSRDITRCDQASGRCATYRCDQNGDACRRISDWYDRYYLDNRDNSANEDDRENYDDRKNNDRYSDDPNDNDQYDDRNDDNRYDDRNDNGAYEDRNDNDSADDQGYDNGDANNRGVNDRGVNDRGVNDRDVIWRCDPRGANCRRVQ